MYNTHLWNVAVQQLMRGGFYGSSSSSVLVLHGEDKE